MGGRWGRIIGFVCDHGLVEIFVHREENGDEAIVDLFCHTLLKVDVAYVVDAAVASVGRRFGSQF